MPILSNSSGRRVGLSKSQGAPQLLRSIAGRPPVKLKVPKAIDDPPVSSSDEEDSTALSDRTPERDTPKARDAANGKPKNNGAAKKSQSPLPDISESSGDERAASVGIKSTTFSSGHVSKTTQRETRSKRKDSPLEPAGSEIKSPIKKRRLGDMKPQSRSKQPGSTPPTSSGEHLRDERGFVKIKKSTATYRKRDNSSQEQPTRKAKEEKRSSPKLRVPDAFKSPEKPRAKMFLVPGNALSPSPPSKLSRKLKFISDDNELDRSSQSSTGRRIRSKAQKPKTVTRSPSPPPAVFRMPASISQLELRTANSAGRETVTDDSSDTENQDGGVDQGLQVDAPVTETAAVCPWCGEPVDKALLEDFSRGKRMNVRQQSKFCQKHKKQTAAETWQQRNYPQVDWDGLTLRFAKHRPSLLDIINGHASHFRTQHEQNIELGKARSMKKEENMNPGYYGPRGFNLMCDYLVEEFSDLLKRKAVADRVIAGRGPAAFIQTVLVAELAVELIMEDMDVTEDGARAILEESKALGEMIHEEA